MQLPCASTHLVVRPAEIFDPPSHIRHGYKISLRHVCSACMLAHTLSKQAKRSMLASAVSDTMPVAREPLLLHLEPAEEPPQQPGGEACRGGGSPWLITTAGFGYLTFSSGMALRRSRGDPGAVAFVVFAYVDLVALLFCLRMYERAEPGSALRDWLKLAVWLLTSALTLSFSHKVAAVMPPAVAALVWAMGLATVAGGFVAFFCFNTPQEMATDKTLRTHAQSSSPLPSFLTLRHPKQICGGTRWPPPSLDLSSLNAHKPIEPRACGVISP